nr:EF-hand calcium-binding domain-containing protein 6 [Anser cygnoides]
MKGFTGSPQQQQGLQLQLFRETGGGKRGRKTGTPLQSPTSVEDHGMPVDDGQFNLLTEKLGVADGGLSYLDFVTTLEDFLHKIWMPPKSMEVLQLQGLY